MTVLLLVPSDPLRPRRPDLHFADEAAAARQLAKTDLALVDHDALERAQTPEQAADAVRLVSGAASDAVYRGWMLDASQYAMLEIALAQRGVTLRTSAEQYRGGHELPGWYEQLAAWTPQSWWTAGPDLDAFSACLHRQGEGAAVLRDYTKSMKHHWHEAALMPDVTDEAACRQIAERFLELRGESFAGGFVVRRFEDYTGAEVRTWWVDGRCVVRGAHPDTPDEEPLLPLDTITALGPVIGSLQLPFVTADLVLRTDGRWRVVEVGDGQVSDRPESISATTLVEGLLCRA